MAETMRHDLIGDIHGSGRTLKSGGRRNRKLLMPWSISEP
jgi:hypothetical protein